MSDSPPLLPDELRAALPRLYATEHDADPLVRAKLFTPWSNWTWFVTEFDGDDTLFGLVSGHEVELGYASLSEIEALEGPGGLRVERDLHFTPKRLSQIRKDLDAVRETPDAAREEDQPAYEARPPATQLFAAAVDPLEHPGIRMVETQLTSSWARVCSGTIATPLDAAKIMHDLIGRSDREKFAALYLNARHKITHVHIVSTGSATAAPVHPREVFKAAVLANAAAVIVGHNHPSGDVTPSPDDNAIVERLNTAGEVLGIEVIDALIVGPTPRYYAVSNGGYARLETSAEAKPPGSAEMERTLLHLEETARFVLSGKAGDMFEESAEELAQQVADLIARLRRLGVAVRPEEQESTAQLTDACRGLLQDIDEVLERQGEEWWDDTVTSGTHHRGVAERLLGRAPYEPMLDLGNDPPQP